MIERKRVRPQLSDEASAYIRGLIMSGSLRPGTQVRPEALGEALQISTTPVREALQSLRVEGFLELVPRKGFQVAPLTGQDIRDIFRVQALIGGELAALATQKATESDLAELEALHHELIAAAARNDEVLLEEKNHAFHREINLLADSRKIIWVMGLVSRYVPRRFYSSIPGWPKATVDDHSKLLEAIRSKDATTARKEMEEHIMHSGELLAAHFDERVSAPERGVERPEETTGKTSKLTRV
ncbi:GntR family transcriptional regulator [Pseudarthrobacter sp. NPDC058119]|uniref:GntR family transcriptional regulator n=1 Tax=Pseudarthrobacter sp. NPDC058119 TaxID=3346348 RepID=UPI0036D9B7CA